MSEGLKSCRHEWVEEHYKKYRCLYCQFSPQDEPEMIKEGVCLTCGNDTRSPQEREHCKDCCCAKSWEALGITQYTGKSIPEHIMELKAKFGAKPMVLPERDSRKGVMPYEQGLIDGWNNYDYEVKRLNKQAKALPSEEELAKICSDLYLKVEVGGEEIDMDGIPNYDFWLLLAKAVLKRLGE